MPAIKHQVHNSSPEISLGEIQIPDDADLGTGMFITILKPGTLPAANVIGSVMIKQPVFQVSVTINPNGRIPVNIGVADGSTPRHTLTFILPQKIDSASRHTLTVHFAKWHIVAATLDGENLSTGPEETIN